MSKSPLRRAVLCLLIILFSTWSLNAQRVNTVVIDAGHGGHDTGALGKNSREKDITLAIALKLRDYIQSEMPGVKVIMTRQTDTFIELYRRARIANENNADLFISIHCNSISSATANGAETFVMGLHKSEANLSVAKAENAAILLEDDYVSQYDGFDPASAEGNIFFSMMQNNFLDKSLDFASNVQHEMVDNLKMFNRGVKQAGFLVLYKTAMPGVLIETGFLSNPKDERFLLSSKGQNQIAYGIARALINYRDGMILHTNNAPTPADELQEALAKPVTIEKQEATNPVSKKETHPAKVNNVPIEKQNDQIAAPAGIDFRVQFAISSSAKSPSAPEFKAVAGVKRYFHKGMYKYTSGSFATFEAAMAHRAEMVNAGYKDAFVVAFRGDERIDVEEARQKSCKN